MSIQTPDSSCNFLDEDVYSMGLDGLSIPLTLLFSSAFGFLFVILILNGLLLVLLDLLDRTIIIRMLVEGNIRHGSPLLLSRLGSFFDGSLEVGLQLLLRLGQTILKLLNVLCIVGLLLHLCLSVIGM